MVSRRGFLGGLAGILTAGVAPPIIKDAMKIYVPPTKIITPFDENFGEMVDFWPDHVPQPLVFGQMPWTPELTLVLPTKRGTGVNELTVQPVYKHFTQMPVMRVALPPLGERVVRTHPLLERRI